MTLSSIRQKQTDVLVKMLNLNNPVGNEAAESPNEEEFFKVLILDQFCQDILSPLISPRDLRKRGITVCFPIHKQRQPIADVPVLYFVQPIPSNLDRIVKDASTGTYHSLYLNFSSSIPRPLLQELATSTVTAGCVDRISNVCEQHLEFVALEHGMFSLGQPLTYLQLNDPQAKDQDVEGVVAGIVNGLFSVLVTLGVVPVIRCPKGGPAEMVASQLDSQIRNRLASQNNLFTQETNFGSSFLRPILCIFDRNFELSVAVQHVWNYRTMVHDVLGMKLNRIVLQGGKSYELNDSDGFWVANSNAQFPKVAEEVEAQLNKYKQDIADVNRRTGGKGELAFDGQELIGNTKHLMSAVDSLPELTERKKMIDKHTNIATALLAEIKARSLDTYFSLEDDMLTRGSVDKNGLLALIKGKGSKEDKLRAAVTFLLALESTPSSEIESVEAALRDAEIDLSAFLYVKKIKSLNTLVASTTGSGKSNIVDWAGKIYGQSISAVTAGVKNLLSGGRQLALTKSVEALMEAKSDTDTYSYLFYDPRATKVGSVTGSYSKGPFKDAIVFMIGGGNYLEYACLQDLGQRQQPLKNIIYGATDILTGKEFVEQLGLLGRKIGFS